MTLMLDEIREQPDIVRAIIETQFKRVETLAQAIVSRKIRFAYIAARGTSDNVATYAKYLFEIEHGIPTALAAPAVFTVYDALPNFGEDCLVLGISRLGEGADVIAVLEQARRNGALTACVTTRENSPLAAVAEHKLISPTGEEFSPAATKSFTSAIAMIALLSTALTPDRPERLEHLRRAANVMERTLQLDDAIRHLVSRYKKMENCVVIGRGYNHATALEVALKITETAFIGAKAYSVPQFLHGPVAQVHEGFPVLLFAPDGKAYQHMVDLAARLKDKHPALIAFANNADFLCRTETAIRVPGPVPEWLSPLVYTMAGQLFAHWLSVATHHDPDRPRALAGAAKA